MCVLVWSHNSHLPPPTRLQQVYHVLDTEFSDCPWPLPPSAILKFLPVDEDPPETHKRRNSESVLRNMIAQGRRLKACSDWEFRDAGSRPACTFFDDATEYRRKPQRAYAFKKGVKQLVPRVRWYQFLHNLTRDQLDAGARMLQCSDVSALTVFWEEQRRMLHAKKGTKWNPQVRFINILFLIKYIIICT